MWHFAGHIPSLPSTEWVSAYVSQAVSMGSSQGRRRWTGRIIRSGNFYTRSFRRWVASQKTAVFREVGFCRPLPYLITFQQYLFSSLVLGLSFEINSPPDRGLTPRCIVLWWAVFLNRTPMPDSRILALEVWLSILRHVDSVGLDRIRAHRGRRLHTVRSGHGHEHYVVCTRMCDSLGVEVLFWQQFVKKLRKRERRKGECGLTIICFKM
jgi:hypothetical protein